MKKWILSALLMTGSLVGEVPHEPKIDQIYWVSGWFANEIYIRTNNQMWWKVISFENSKPGQWKVGDGVVFSKYPFENPSQYWLINVDHFGGAIVEYHSEPLGFNEQE